MKQFPDVDFPAGEPGGQFVALVDECCNGQKPQGYCASPFWWRYCLKVDWPDQQLIILYEMNLVMKMSLPQLHPCTFSVSLTWVIVPITRLCTMVLWFQLYMVRDNGEREKINVNYLLFARLLLSDPYHSRTTYFPSCKIASLFLLPSPVPSQSETQTKYFLSL